ncbi:hypothetical protein [Haladaptatus sp. DFWS20]|uniref:hypothetical protein n=1 Tax=Haladaptatus sp. DFWS20 TaxID=3403467 RepID=UPI003EB8DC5B
MSTNYLDTNVPRDKDPADYTYVERRADLLDRIIAAGSRKNIHQARLAEVYDVSPAQVSKDIARIGEEIADHLTDDIELQTLTMYEHTVSQLQDDGRYKAAWDVHCDFLEWVGYEPTTEKETEPTPTHQDDIRDLPPETQHLFTQWAGQEPTDEPALQG